MAKRKQPGSKLTAEAPRPPSATEYAEANHPLADVPPAKLETRNPKLETDLPAQPETRNPKLETSLPIGCPIAAADVLAWRRLPGGRIGVVTCDGRKVYYAEVDTEMQDR